MRLIISISLLLLTLLTGCSSKKELVFDPTASTKNAVDYLTAAIPLSVDLIKLPFLYDGDLLIETEYSRNYWYNKPFNSLYEAEHLVLEKQLFFKYKKGVFYGIKGELIFDDLYVNLLNKLSPFQNAIYTGDYLIINLIKNNVTNSVIYVIEEYKTGKIVGFID